MSFPRDGIYGGWAGNPKGHKEHPERCREEIWPSVGWIPYQCQRKRGFGFKGEFCKQHGRKYETKQQYRRGGGEG